MDPAGRPPGTGFPEPSSTKYLMLSLVTRVPVGKFHDRGQTGTGEHVSGLADVEERSGQLLGAGHGAAVGQREGVHAGRVHGLQPGGQGLVELGDQEMVGGTGQVVDDRHRVLRGTGDRRAQYVLDLLPIDHLRAADERLRRQGPRVVLGLPAAVGPATSVLEPS